MPATRRASGPIEAPRTLAPTTSFLHSAAVADMESRLAALKSPRRPRAVLETTELTQRRFDEVDAQLR